MDQNSLIYYGGSFNPPHISHVLFVSALRAYYPEAEVWIGPTYSHAFNKSLLPFEDRVQMCHAAFDLISGVRITTIERELHESTSYTVDVVREILKREPAKKVYVAVGADIVPTLPKWREYEALCQMGEFLVFPREGYDNDCAIEMPHLPEISSSSIREAMRIGDWGFVRKFVPAKVVELLRILA